MTRMACALLGTALLMPLAAQQADSQKPEEAKKEQKKAQKKAKKTAGAPKSGETAAPERRRIRFVFTPTTKRPSFRWRGVIRADFRVKMQSDFRHFDPELEHDLFSFNRRRIGIQGTFLRDFEFEVERELRVTDIPWKDVYVNFNRFRRFQIQGGRFKVPFSYDQLTGHTDLDFVYRSRIADQLAPGRDLGLMAHGRLFNRRLRYYGGLFREDGDNSRLDNNVGSGERTFAGRVTGTPLSLLPVPKPLKTAEFGVSVLSTALPQGLKGLRGRTAIHEDWWERYFVHGQRRRLGLEFVWMPGPFSLKGEYITVSDQRIGQALRGTDLPDLQSRGWYASGTWCLTGEPKAGDIVPRKAFISGRGIGAIEIGVRWEAMRFGSAEHIGTRSRGTRSANLIGNSERAWTFGVNWYLNRWSKIQYNAIRETIEDFRQPRRVPIPNERLYWLHAVRLQFAL